MDLTLCISYTCFILQASGMNSGDGAKNIDNNKEHFLVYSQPVYIELPKEKTENSNSNPDMKTGHNALAV